MIYKSLKTRDLNTKIPPLLCIKWYISLFSQAATARFLAIDLSLEKWRWPTYLSHQKLGVPNKLVLFSMHLNLSTFTFQREKKSTQKNWKTNNKKRGVNTKKEGKQKECMGHWSQKRNVPEHLIGDRTNSPICTLVSAASGLISLVSQKTGVWYKYILFYFLISRVWYKYRVKQEKKGDKGILVLYIEPTLCWR